MVSCGDSKLLIARHIKAFGLSVFKNGASVADILPLFAVKCHIAVTLKHNKSGFLILCIIFQRFAAVKLNHTELEHF